MGEHVRAESVLRQIEDTQPHEGEVGFAHPRWTGVSVSYDGLLRPRCLQGGQGGKRSSQVGALVVDGIADEETVALAPRPVQADGGVVGRAAVGRRIHKAKSMASG